MPVIVVGADTPVGAAIIDALLEPDREVRAFVTSVGHAEELRAKGVKVALGDVSDASHVEGASLHCFSAVLITEAALDGRERSFASHPAAVLRGWADAVKGVERVIWVGTSDPPKTRVDEVAVIAEAGDHSSVAERVSLLDGLDSEHFKRALEESGI